MANPFSTIYCSVFWPKIRKNVVLGSCYWGGGEVKGYFTDYSEEGFSIKLCLKSYNKLKNLSFYCNLRGETLGLFDGGGIFCKLLDQNTSHSMACKTKQIWLNQKYYSLGLNNRGTFFGLFGDPPAPYFDPPFIF